MKIFNLDLDFHTFSYLLADSISFFRHHSARQNLNMLRFMLGHKNKPLHVPWNPVRITLGVEYRCNLHCTFCPWHSADAKKPLTPFECTLEDAKRILDVFIPKNLAHVHFCAVGEPTLNPDLPAMIRYAGEKGLTASFMTNFSSIVTPKLDEIARLPILKVYGDLDTGDPAQFDVLRPGHSFQTLCSNISYLAKKRDEVGNRFKIGVYALMMKSNYHTFRDIMRTAREIGVDEVHMVYLTPSSFNEVTACDNAVYLEDAEIVQYLKEARDYGRSLGLRVFMNQFTGRDPDFEGIVSCNNTWWKLFVNMPNEKLDSASQFGNVCSQCEASIEGDYHTFGNLFEDGFDHCWNGPRIKELRHRLLNDPPGPCRTCPGR